MTPPVSTLRSPSRMRSSTVLSAERDDVWKSAARRQKLVNVTAVCAPSCCAPGAERGGLAMIAQGRGTVGFS